MGSAAPHGEQLRRGSAKADFSGAEPPRAHRPAPGTPRGSGRMGGCLSADAGPPERESLRPGPAWRALPGGERGRRGDPASRTDGRAGTEGGGRSAGRAGLCVPPGGGDLRSRSRRPGSDGPLPRPVSANRGGAARTRAAGEGEGRRRDVGGESPSKRQPSPSPRAPHTPFAPLTRVLQRWCRPGSE